MERAVRTSSLASSHRPIKKGGYKTFTDHTALSAIFRAMRLAVCYRCSSSTKRCRMFLALRKTSAGGKFDTLKDALTCLVGLLAPTISYQSSAISDRRIGYPCDGHAQKAKQKRQPTRESRSVLRPKLCSQQRSLYRPQTHHPRRRTLGRHDRMAYH
jgi:hypothetical protein